MDSKLLSLSWDAYEKSICNGLSSLQQQGQFVDMTLAADGHHVKVHQMVVSLVSPFIMDLIKSANCPHPVIFLNKVSYSTLQSILEYAYTGQVMVAPECLSSFLEACKDLHIKGLEDVSIQGGMDLLNVIETRDVKDFDTMEVPFEHSESPTPIKSSVSDIDEPSPQSPPKLESDRSNFLLSERPRKTVKRRRIDKIKKENTSEHEYSHKAEFENLYIEIEPYKAGSRWFCRDEYFYVVQRTKGQTCYLRCASEKCPVTWTLSAKRGVGPVMGTHNHSPTPWVLSRNAMFQALRRRTTTENLPLSVIYEQEAARYKDAAPHLPLDSVTPSMRKWRRSAQLAVARELQSMG